jgi:hypothetical protein
MEEKYFQVIFGIVIAMLGWFFKTKVEGMQKQIDEATSKVTEIQVNYLDRFADLREIMSRGHGEIKDAIGLLREDLAKNYVSKTDCPQLHK